MYFYAANSGFYDLRIHGDNIPKDAVEISEELYADLLKGQSNGKRIIPDANGFPVLSDPLPKTLAEELADKSAEARSYLASTDWYVIRQQETGEPVPDHILAARKASRTAVVQ